MNKTPTPPLKPCACGRRHFATDAPIVHCADCAPTTSRLSRDAEAKRKANPELPLEERSAA